MMKQEDFNESRRQLLEKELQEKIKPIFDNFTFKVAPIMENFSTEIFKVFEPIKLEVAKLQHVSLAISTMFKHHKYIWPETYEFLLKMKIGLNEEEIKVGLKSGSIRNDDLFYYFARVPKGADFDTPSIVVTEEIANAIDLILKNRPQTLVVETNKIEFDDKVPQLIINGMPLPLKRNSDRYQLCKFMFKDKIGKKIPWELEDIVTIALGNNYYSGDDWYSKVYGKIRRLNEAIEKHIGYKDFIIPQNRMFTINTPYLFLLYN